MLEIRYQSQFKRDYKKILKRGYEEGLLWQVLEKLRNEEPLPERCRDHLLAGAYVGYRECHIQPDWLLIYKIDKGTLFLVRTGTHSDLF